MYKNIINEVNRKDNVRSKIDEVVFKRYWDIIGVEWWDKLYKCQQNYLKILRQSYSNRLRTESYTKLFREMNFEINKVLDRTNNITTYECIFGYDPKYSDDYGFSIE